MRRGLEAGWGWAAYLESLRVFVYLACRLVVIERVPEHQAQIFIDFQWDRVGSSLELLRDTIERPGLGNDLVMVEGTDRQGEGWMIPDSNPPRFLYRPTLRISLRGHVSSSG
jgi:hypothetical protein